MNIIENVDVIIHRKLSEITQCDYIIRIEYSNKKSYFDDDYYSPYDNDMIIDRPFFFLLLLNVILPRTILSIVKRV